MDPMPGAAAPTEPADVDEWWANVRAGLIDADPLDVARHFLERVQWPQPPGVADPEDGWLRLPDRPGRQPTWEHATWLRPHDLTDGLLRDAVHPDWCVVDYRSWTAEERVTAVAAAPGEFVALITPSRRFDRLVDRRALLLTLGETYAESVKAR